MAKAELAGQARKHELTIFEFIPGVGGYVASDWANHRYGLIYACAAFPIAFIATWLVFHGRALLHAKEQKSNPEAAKDFASGKKSD